MYEWIFQTATNAEEKSSATYHHYIITGAVLFLLLHYIELLEETSYEELHIMMKLLRIVPITNDKGIPECPGYSIITKCLSDPEIQLVHNI